VAFPEPGVFTCPCCHHPLDTTGRVVVMVTAFAIGPVLAVERAC